MNKDFEVKAAAKIMSKLGASKGGKARAEVLTPEERQRIAKEAITVRWSRTKDHKQEPDIPRATHSGVINIGDVSIPCAVLEDGTRVLTQWGFLRAIGRSGRPAAGRGSDVEKVAPFLALDNLTPYVSNELANSTKPTIFRLPSGVKAYYYKAELLPQVCEVYLRARDEGVLLKSQEKFARACDMLMRGLAHVGIVALVDEATGYQEVRDRLALQEILDKFLRKEFAAWAKQFPHEFYQGIFRLRNWQWRGMKVNPPQIVAYYTKDLVYARLAPGIVKELELRNPMTERGYRKHKHYQYLTEDVGLPALAQHLHAVTGLMRIADTWKQFMEFMDKGYPRRGDTLQLPLFEGEKFETSE
jgi:P63C domain